LEKGGAALSDVKPIEGLTPQWEQYKTTLTANATEDKAKLVLAANSKGTVWFDMVSLFPAKTFKDRKNGMRQDIAQMIADLKPGFVRFPGGCVVEAATVETVYNWKNTIGPVAERPEVWNAWDYRRTHGVGLFEYFQFIEDLGAAPMYVAFAGQTCIYRAPAVVPMDQMQPIVDGYLDLVEYANGAADSKWGKSRAEAGHAKPFDLKLVEIGNENTGPAYAERYRMIFSALKGKYPDIQTIADLPLRGQTVEMIDEHHYADPNWFFNNSKLYDRANRQTPLYLGEVAVTSGAGVPPERGSLQAALAEGTYLLGAERNGDVVKMASYAPLLANVDGRTELAGAPPPWHGMIYFNSNKVYGTVSYYLWKLFGTNRPSVNLETAVAANGASTGIVGNVGLGTWGTSAEYKDFKVEKDGKVIYSTDFARGADDWKTEGGRWSVVDGAYRQARNANGFSYVGDEDLTDYTMSVKAKKIAGGEGFLIIFGHQGGDRYWWNIGGYGNTRHEVEANQALVGRAVNGSIKTDQWYDIKVELKGRQVKCYLDGELIHDLEVPPNPGPLAAQAGRDETTGEIVVKAVNRSAKPITATVDISGAEIGAAVKETVLTSKGIQDNNSFAEPLKVAPVEKQISVTGPKFEYEFPAQSMTVLRMKSSK
jgi:alpha-L-arabinofuranosidase